MKTQILNSQFVVIPGISHIDFVMLHKNVGQSDLFTFRFTGGGITNTYPVYLSTWLDVMAFNSCRIETKLAMFAEKVEVKFTSNDPEQTAMMFYKTWDHHSVNAIEKIKR